ncbi:MAG: hypothetical protein Q8930_11620 [Bacillota bacterium]|nr:hypothetical protein [Bacillota bacterium]
MKKIVTLISILIILIIITIAASYYFLAFYNRTHKNNDITAITSTADMAEVLSKMMDPGSYEDKVDKIVSELANSNDQDYLKYVDIKMDKPGFVYNQTTEAGDVDNENCNIVYRIKFKNITNENYHLNYKIFVPQELASTIIYAPVDIGPESNQPLIKPGQGITTVYSPVMKHTDKLDDNQKKLLDQYGSTLYCELKIDGKTFYLKITSS